MKYVLCQDCLRVLPYSDARHDEEEFCVCGGAFCGCESCNSHALELIEEFNDETSIQNEKIKKQKVFFEDSWSYTQI